MPVMHVHHIVPRHAEPGFANNCVENLVTLTVAEHAEAHLQLWLKNGHWQDRLAYMILSNQIGREEADLIALRESNRNRVWTPEQRQHFSRIRKGKSRSEADRRAIKAGVNNSPHKDLMNVGKGTHWFNNGIENRRLKPTDSIPPGFVRGRI
jgi:hypothetical protein